MGCYFLPVFFRLAGDLPADLPVDFLVVVVFLVVDFAAGLPADLRTIRLRVDGPAAAFLAISSTACSSVTASGFIPLGSVALMSPCFT